MLVVALGTIACSSDHMGTGPVASRLVFSVQPSTATAGVVLTPAVQVTALDDAGGVVTSFSGTITIALATNPGSATLSGTLTVGAVGGVATFSDLRLNRTGAGYAFRAASGALPAATSAAFTIAAAPPQQLAYVVQPTDVVAGAAIAPAVQVQARDSLGNLTPGFTGTVSLVLTVNAGGAVLAGTTAVSAVAGVATFSALHVDKSGSAYTIQAASGVLAAATSAAFNVAAAAAKQLAFTVQPSAVVAGAAIAPAVQVTARDTFGNTATGFTGPVAIALGANAAGGTLSGTTPVSAVAGVAAFSDLSISKSGSGYTLIASATGLLSDTSSGFAVSPGGFNPAQSTVVALPGSISASAGGSAATITVTVKDQLGNPVPGMLVVLAATGTGNTLTQPASATDSNGVASGHLSSTVAESKVVSATVSGTALSQTATVIVTAAAASSLGFTVQPVTTVATSPITPAVQVTASDPFGNRVTGFTGNVTIAIGANPGGGVLSGTVTVAADSGVATFANLRIDKAAPGYTLIATSGALAPATSQPFTISVGAAAKLVFAVQPSNAVAGTIMPAVQVAVQDAGGNLVTTATNSIGMAIGTNPGGGTLSGTTAVSAVNGVAQFTNLSIDKTGTAYTLQATSTGLMAAVSNAFNITSGTADHLAFFVQPSDAVAGTAIAPAVQVEVEDAIGNRVTSSTASVTIAILDNPNGGALSGTIAVSALSGVATFSTLNINKSGTGYSLSASAAGMTSAASNDFNITPGTATRVSFFVEPSSTIAGSVITPDVEVQVLDAFGNRVPTATNSVTVAFAANPGSGTLSGTLTEPAVAGLATFSDLSINKVGTGYRLKANAGVLTPDTSLAFNVAPGPATTLAFSVQPSQAVATAAIAPAVKVTAIDVQGNIATGFTGSVTMAIANNAGGGTLSGTLSVSAVAGVATFSDLQIDKVGTGYTLGAAAAGLTAATSSPFNVIVGTPTRLAFFTQPAGTTGGATLATVQVEVQDAGGNRVTSASNSIAMAFGTNANAGTLSGTTTRTAVNGVAAFNDLSIDSAGTGYTLAASSSGLTGVTSPPFNIMVGPAVKLGFLVPPSNTVPGQPITPAIQVEVRDLGGNRVTSSGASVALAIGNNPSNGTLSGTTSQAAVSGLATFSGLSINNAGSGYTLIASSTGLTSATSPPFDISVGTATKLGFLVQPTSTTGGAAISPAVQVEIEDVGGNRVGGATNSVTLGIATNPTGFATLSGTKTVAAVDGIATFNGLSIDSAGTGYTLNASASGLAGANSSAFNVTVGPAAKLGFHVPPSNATGGVAIAPAVQVEVQDAGGNRVTSASNSVALSISTNPNAGTLSGTTSQAAVSGVATFSNLSIDSAGTGYRLGATSGGLSDATSPAFNITVGPATQVGFSVQPSNVTAGTSITPAVKVEIRDAGGNRVTTASNSVAVAIATNAGGGTLSGTTSRAATSGVATFSNLSINKSGIGYTLAATSTGLAPATSSGFTVSADGVSAALSTLASTADTVGQCSVSCSSTFQTSTVNVTVRDQFGNLVTGSPVVVSANGTGNVFSPSGSGTTDANGQFTTSYNAAVVETKTLSATAGGIGITQTAAVAVMPVLVGAGDIADCNSIRDDSTASQLDTIPGVVFADGDNAYPNGTASNFTNCYDPTWGRHKARTRPVVGNHEYDSSGTAAPYFAYFGAAAADPLGNGFGYYSYDVGAWHIVVLNSDSGVTSASSNQLAWLQNDLVGRTNQCVLALWHRPLFTSGSSGGAGVRVRRLWQALENAGAEIIINGHDHLYERFAPQDSLGNATSAGIREFVVGTGGGETHSNYVNNPPNVEASDAANFSRGVLRLTLYPNSYRWDFLATAGPTWYSDSGSASCH